MLSYHFLLGHPPDLFPLLDCHQGVAYIAEMKPQKTVILTDSKAALQSLIPDKLIHQLLKDLQLLPHECNVVLHWIPANFGIPGNERADHLAKSGSKQLQPLSTSTYQEDKTLLRKDVNGEEPLETTTPLQTQSTVWQDMSRPLCSGCKQDIVACEHTWSELSSWTLHSAVAKKRNRQSTTFSRTASSGGNRDTSYDCRMSQPPTSCGERQKTCAAPPNFWQHVGLGSKHSWSTAEEEEPS